MIRRPPRSTLFPYTTSSDLDQLPQMLVLVAGHHERCFRQGAVPGWIDRKSTRLNSSHSQISYAVFCLKKKTHNHHCLSHIDLQYALRLLSLRFQRIVTATCS